MNLKNLVVPALVGGLLLASACGGKKDATTSTDTANTPVLNIEPLSLEPVDGDSPAMAKSKEMYKTYCISCHGDKGMGDGAAAAALNPKPRAYSDQEWQNKVDDAHIKKVILEGGAAVGLSQMMTPWAAVFEPLENTDEVLDGIVAYIRSFKAK